MNFVSIDVETANADRASICQIGLATFRNGALVSEWATYVDPEDFFDAINVSIHGIQEETVLGRPAFPLVAVEVQRRLKGQIVVSHTSFDRISIQQAFRRYGLLPPECTWLDSARVTRRTWDHCSSSGYGLKSICDFLGYEFSHHDALEDARAAGHVMLAAAKESNLTLGDWVDNLRSPRLRSPETIARDGDPEGPLFGEVVVFTGALATPRRKAADLAASQGCKVTAGVTKKTTMLVVGDQDVRQLRGESKSSKHRKAEERILAGQPIRILRETDFEALVNL